jgi:hypothetical protein
MGWFIAVGISFLHDEINRCRVGTFGATMLLWVIGFAGDFAGKVFGE